ncbi:efflux RND transporter periplasmic adaptor subunit [Leptospira bouyouniensis]|uniref:Efflux RND transporter periplasmic adaptor subunit n=1 Tax=Leptospira bouyouniensis TaxID=2484911 RepID=A0A7I0IUD5_9LEPT|nr:efflux RND transporter periplasmic adaptor subunit [Leptospira bouyouniensis]TGL09157.1 efflux RND transporter periplasmic adaptor subunit [Leptospira bouyouniensis]
MLKEKLATLSKIPFFSKIVISSLVYLGISIAYSNMTWAELRTKLPFFNRIFYSKYLSANELFANYKNQNKEESLREEGNVVPVKTIAIEEEIITPILTYAAIVEPIEKVDIFSKVSGRIEEFNVKEGDKVKKGQKIARIESLSFELDIAKQQAALDSSKALYQLSKDKYENARRNVEIKLGEADKKLGLYYKALSEFERFQEIARKKEILFEEKVISNEELENIKLELSSREVNLNNARRELEMSLVGIRDEDIIAAGFKVPEDKKSKIELIKNINTKIEKSEMEVAAKNMKSNEVNLSSTQMLLKETQLISPIDGIIAKISRNKGELVNAGSGGGAPIMTVISNDGVYVAFSVNEGDLGKIKVGFRANIKADSFPDLKFKGIVKKISPLVDQKTHTADVKVEVAGNITDLRPGIFVRSEVIVGSDSKAILIPISTLVSTDGSDGSVFIMKNKRAFKKNVVIGEKRDERVIVSKGLESGDVIITSPINRLFEGVSVKPSI